MISGTTLPGRPYEYEYGRENEIITCPWHGWQFEIATGASIFNPHRVRVRSYEVTVEHAGALGEGWSDFTGLLLVLKPEDVGAPAGANFTGCYPTGSYALSRSFVANEAYYFGVRRYWNPTHAVDAIRAKFFMRD